MDEFSGDRHVTPCVALSAVENFKSLMNLVYNRYNAHGHRVTHMVSDSLPAFEAVIPVLGAMGITLAFTPPGQHAQHIERWFYGWSSACCFGFVVCVCPNSMN